MQFLKDVQKKGVTLMAENATTLLTAGGVVGTVATAVLAGRAGIKAGRILEAEENQIITDANDTRVLDDLTFFVKVKLVGLQFAPPVLTGTATVASIIMANRVSAQKAAALAAAYGLAERNLSEYKEKVAEKLTGPKTQQIDDEIAQDRVNRTPGHDNVIIVEGDGDVLCFDESTGRYFKSNPEKIRRAVNAANAEILRHGGASVSYFYDELELPPTSWSDTVGWGIGEQIEIKFSYVKDPNDKPCLSIDFAKTPSMNWNESYS